ncbi:hypothetical protein [Streptomyces sp. NPDC091268]|uniref:baeRF2 domain-containing protein n=1 Tax=Streptomyces sp. NPDC091268 TaxID=3365979 RepID=UPI0038244037
MKLRFLAPLYAHPGPIASVLLDTSRDGDDPDRALDLRWRRLRKRLLAHEADKPTVAVVEAALGADSGVGGRHGRAVFAAGGRLLADRPLPEPPVRDSALYGMLPDALELALQYAPGISYTAVLIRRVQVHAPEPGGAVEEDFDVHCESGTWPMSRVAPGAHVHRRFPVESWPGQAERLRGELLAGMEGDGSEVIALVGDPWAVNSLARPAPGRLHGAFVKLEDGHHPHRPEPGRALLEEELELLFDGRLPHRDEQQIDAYLGQRARHRQEVEGLAATVAALQRGQARALILDVPVDLDRRLRVGTEANHLALSGEELSAFGLTSHWEEPAPGAALIRAAVGTRAELIAVPRAALPLTDGAAVLLRYTAPDA